MKDSTANFITRIKDGLVYGLLAAIMTIGLAFVVAALIGESTDDRVRELKADSALTREVLCLAVLRPGLNLEDQLSADDYQRIVVLCGEYVND